MNNEPYTVSVVAGFIAAYYTHAGRPVIADFTGPCVTVYDTDDDYHADAFADPEHGPDVDVACIAFVVRASGSGFDIFAVDTDDADDETWHAHVRSDFDYFAVADACANGVAFD